MCGFVAYTGREQASAVLLDALSLLGACHDGAGVAIPSGTGISRGWSSGQAWQLSGGLGAGALQGRCGLAQAGSSGPRGNGGDGPPFVDCHQEVALAVAGEVLVHTRLRGELARRGHFFRSASSGEAVAHLAEDLWVPPLHLTLARTVQRLEGRFSVVAITVREPGRLVCTSWGVPLLLTRTTEGVLVVSGHGAQSPNGQVISLRRGEIAVVDAEGFDVLAPDAMGRVARVSRAVTTA